MMSMAAERESPHQKHAAFDGSENPLARRIVDLHIWAMQSGLRGATAGDLFDGYCQRLVITGFPLMRAYVSTQTLHPQWSGYGYTWRRDLNSVHYQQFARGGGQSEQWLRSPFYAAIVRAQAGEANPWLRRRLELGPEHRDFPALIEFHAAGATDYVCTLYRFGEHGDAAHGKGVVYSFTTDRTGGFDDEQLELLRSTLPGLSLAMKAHAGYDIASSLLQTYLGHDAGSRVHNGAVERGAAHSLHAVLWYADIRGFTSVSDTSAGPAVIEMLDDVFEILTASLRTRGGQVLKFIGDAMLATFSFEKADQAETCHRALDAAIEAMRALEARNAERAAAGLPTVSVDLALHVGEVLYGNVGAADRLDFTVIGPAVNEVARIEKLCDALGRKVLVSAQFVGSGLNCAGRLESLGRFTLRGVAEPKEIFGLIAEGAQNDDTPFPDAQARVAASL
jgi:adenylate cyclase